VTAQLTAPAHRSKAFPRWRKDQAVSAGSSHLFVCFSSKDEAVARQIVGFLEERDLKCWISLRDVPPGENYQETIVQALEAAQGIVFLFSENSNRSSEIKKELSIGGGLNTPVFPVRLSPITPSGALRYELATRQWVDIFPDAQQALEKLAETIRKVLADPGAAETEVPVRPAATPAPATPSQPKKKPKPRAPVIAADSQEFEATRALLARHIGPIAKVLVQKAAAEAQSLDEFCEQLAAHVRAPNDRAAFLQATRARLKA
jgi:TIR domain-containing protein